MNRHSRISDDEARELWRRATELQRAAEQRETEPEPEVADGALSALASAGLPAEHVVAAATQAGISKDHVLLALAERRLTDWEAIRPERWSARWLRRLVSDDDAIETARYVRAEPAVVLRAIEAVAGRSRLELKLEDRFGEDAAQGLVLVYRTAGAATSAPSSFHWGLDLADGRVVLATIRGEDDGTWLRLRAPLYRRALNFGLSGVAAGTLGGGGAAVAAAIGEAAAGMIGLATAATAASLGVLGAIVGGGLGLRTYRSIYRWGWRKGDAAVGRLAGAVVAEAEGVERPADPSRGNLPMDV